MAESDDNQPKSVPPSEPEGENGKASGTPLGTKQRKRLSRGEATVGQKGRATELGAEAAGQQRQDEGGGEKGEKQEDQGRRPFLTNPDAVKCVSCREYLSSPVYQCDDGHLVCDNCHSKFAHSCPLTECEGTLFEDQRRCLAVEKILQYLMLSCPNAEHGCREVFNPRDLKLHAKACEFSPFSCPFPDCNCRCSSKQFSHHFKTRHAAFQRTFLFDRSNSFTFSLPFEVYVLEAEKEGALFLLKNETQELGYLITINYLLASSKVDYICEIDAWNGRNSLKIVNAKVGDARVDAADGAAFLLVPKKFFGGCMVHFGIRIWVHPRPAKGHWC